MVLIILAIARAPGCYVNCEIDLPNNLLHTVFFRIPMPSEPFAGCVVHVERYPSLLKSFLHVRQTKRYNGEYRPMGQFVEYLDRVETINKFCKRCSYGWVTVNCAVVPVVYLEGRMK